MPCEKFFARGREPGTAPHLEFNQGRTQHALKVAQQAPCRTVRQAELGDRRGKRTLGANRAEQRQEPRVERFGRFDERP